MKNFSCVLAILLALAIAPCASAYVGDTVMGALAAESANKVLLADLPLPMLYHKKATWKVGLRPYLYTGTADSNYSENGFSNVRTGSFKGWGGGVTASYSFADSWAAYFFVSQSKLASGDFKNIQTTPQQNTTTILVTDNKASFISFNPGVTYQFYGTQEGSAAAVFAGPVMILTKFNSSIRETDRNTGSVNDYDTECRLTTPGASAGVQAGFDVFKKFKLNPFAMLGWMKTQPITGAVTRIRLAQIPDANPFNSNLASLQRGEQYDRGGVFGSIGLNAIYKPWGVSVNLLAPFVKETILKIGKNTSDNFKITQISIAWAFGNYVK